ncbi:vicilin-like seed storage protein At2g28490 [Cornus florida]|uniref:vicilin-like seed storage protein At2g28490 n=1 Tax=Cornus florida TaxID=4283 RepID=UPI00289EFFAE|nr:vicilin-like seed storage protein At2g28490 [Cornus florida]
MGKRSALLLVVLVMCHAVATVGGYFEDPEGRREREEGRREREEGKREREGLFLLRDSKHVVRTDAGDMRLVRGYGGRIMERPMHIGFINMEPNSLFIPQYIDCSLILFIRRGEARVGSIYKDDLVEKRLTAGDLYRIPAGSAFYLVNPQDRQKLHVICSVDTSESLNLGNVQSFFIGGGSSPTSILAGFDPQTLAAALNISAAEVRELTTRQQSGPIIRLSNSHPPSLWTQFLHLEEHERLAHLKRMVYLEEEANEDEVPTWSFRKLLTSVFGEKNKDEDIKRSRTSPDSCNLYNRQPDYKNRYGWCTSLDESDYSPLSNSGNGIYLVNLTAGSMMAPHVNPTATEYGVVLRGSGTIQIVFPNGTSAMNARVKEGDVFWVPRYFPFCQIASRNGPFEFFGFTTSEPSQRGSERRNRPQFLVGKNSVLNNLRNHESAAAFGVSRKRLRHILNAQREAVILPASNVAPPETMQEEEDKMKNNVIPEVIRNFGNDMVMGFD